MVCALVRVFERNRKKIINDRKAWKSQYHSGVFSPSISLRCHVLAFKKNRRQRRSLLSNILHPLLLCAVKFDFVYFLSKWQTPCFKVFHSTECWGCVMKVTIKWTELIFYLPLHVCIHLLYLFMEMQVVMCYLGDTVNTLVPLSSCFSATTQGLF